MTGRMNLISVAPAAVAFFLCFSTTSALDLCDRGFKNYSSEYLFLLDSYASLAPRFFVDDAPFTTARSGRSKDSGVMFPGPQRMRFKKAVQSPSDCARECCSWSSCSMMVYETHMKSCVLVICDDELIKSGTCEPALDEENTNLFTAQSIDTDVVFNATSNAKQNASDPLSLVDAVREPHCYVTVYLRLRSSLLKAYLDELRTMSAEYSLTQLELVSSATNGSASLVAAIESELQQSDVPEGKTEASLEGILTKPCEMDHDCTTHERCSYTARQSPQKAKSHKHTSKRKRHAERKAKSSSSETADSISRTELESLMDSFEEDYEEVSVDNDAGVCICVSGYMRVNASRTSPGNCIIDPTYNKTKSKTNSTLASNQNQTGVSIVIVQETDPNLLFGLLAIDMEGAGLVYLMIIVVVGLLALLMFTWLCVLCKVRIATCLRSCCQKLCKRSNEPAQANSRTSTGASSAPMRRGEYRALLTDEAQADAQPDDEDDEDVSFERNAIPMKPANGTNKRGRDSSKKK